MASIFISYRREDTIAYAGRLYDRLHSHFGRMYQVFMDLDTIPPGADFIETIQRTVGSCHVLIAVIGRQWLTAVDNQGRLRLHNPEDFVRQEIQAALDRNIRVIPILVGGARMPTSQDLPPELASFARRNAFSIHDDSFHQGMTRLIETLEQALAETEEVATPEGSTQLANRRTQPAAQELSKTRVSAPLRLQSSPTGDRNRSVRLRRKTWVVSGAAILIVALAAAVYHYRSNEIAARVNPRDGLTYVWIPPGKFMMGCSPEDEECDSSEKDAHEVTIREGFWIGRTEVTQEAYERVTGKNPSRFKGAKRPVEEVSWNDADAYCRAIAERLPTEAEWEYAARGGERRGRYGELAVVGWYGSNSGGTTHEVGLKPPNARGLFDMLGNVSEWVADWYGSYSKEPTVDPRGPLSGQYRVARGGSWLTVDSTARASARDRYGPDDRNRIIGFRCAGD